MRMDLVKRGTWLQSFNTTAKCGTILLCHILPFRISHLPNPPPPPFGIASLYSQIAMNCRKNDAKKHQRHSLQQHLSIEGQLVVGGVVVVVVDRIMIALLQQKVGTFAINDSFCCSKMMHVCVGT